MRSTTNPLLSLRVPLILASSSPRRTQLLHQLGIPHTVKKPAIEETIPSDLPHGQIVETLALQKAQAVAPEYPQALTLAADTLVVLGNEILGKPQNEQEAYHTLKKLSGQKHTVYTGIALLHPASQRTYTTHEATQVYFASLSDEEIWAYIQTGSPLDKAGAYGIQDDMGALFIPRIEGDYYTVVGLPLHRFYTAIRTHFTDLLLP